MSVEAVIAPPEAAVTSTYDAPASAQTTCLAGLAALDAALEQGLLEDWRRLADSDPRASVYQTPGWCVPWYRIYNDAYDPFVVVVRDAGRIVGVVPMAVERATRQLVFASDAMADYRDIVARPEHRATVTAALIDAYLAGDFAGTLRIGWSDPSSDTPALATAACRRRGLQCVVRHQPCWRWFPEPGENLQKKFSRIKTHLNHFKRQGNVSFDVVTDVSEWRDFAETFYRQHSLRQLQASREVSFGDPRKRQLYDTLFAAGELPMHVTACRVNGRMIAGHLGLLWRDVLLFGAPSINLEDEHRSPAVILLAWIIQNAASLGLAGFDLTIGESEFKRRLGNRCVELTQIEIYRHRRDYYLERARSRAVDAAKGAVDSVLGEGAWKERVKPAAAALRHKRERFGELGVIGTLSRAAAFVAGGAPSEITYSAPREAIRPAVDRHRHGVEHHENQVDDLLLCDATAPSILAALNACARTYARSRAAGHTLHTLVDHGRLTAWCYAHPSDGDVVVEAVTAPGGADAVSALIGDIAAARGDAARIVVRTTEDARRTRAVLGPMGFRIVGGA